MKVTGKGGLIKRPGPLCSHSLGSGDSGSDLLPSKLERWCQVLDTAPGGIPTRPRKNTVPHPAGLSVMENEGTGRAKARGKGKVSPLQPGGPEWLTLKDKEEGRDLGPPIP